MVIVIIIMANQKLQTFAIDRNSDIVVVVKHNVDMEKQLCATKTISCIEILIISKI